MLRRNLGLLALVAVEVPLALLSMLMLLGSFALGLVPFFPPTVMLVRRVTQLARRTLDIDVPYHPEPPPPVPQADGWYRSDRTLYKTPRVPRWNDRWKWMFGDPATWRDFVWLLFDPVVKLALAVPLLLFPSAAHRVYGQWAALLLAPTAKSRLAGQVKRLSEARTTTVDSQAAEMRRIERDLHDGAQARLVALGMTLGAVEELVKTNPTAAMALLAKAREASAEALSELRGVVRGIHPPVLAERGLGDAVKALALDSPLHVEVQVDLPVRLDTPVETALYFAISELLSNAARHSDADRVTVDISHSERDVTVMVWDDGGGGADPSRGSGLNGIERRLAAFDGVMALSSPPGGPTTVAISVPLVLPEEYGKPKVRMPKWQLTVVALCWGLAWCPLFPQGLVTAFMKIIGFEHKSWFLALYLDEPWQWPVIIGMILLGMLMYGVALYLPVRHNRERWMDEAHPRRPWFASC
ncbi:sensor histidine kinase [Nonomuraea sp. NPDC059194]|uniref:sensor histidine kinase n=1 Tax=Nonomuraea sp. NPDC059194 TaxID=3346764 RepID=UPI0036BB0E63